MCNTSRRKLRSTTTSSVFQTSPTVYSSNVTKKMLTTSTPNTNGTMASRKSTTTTATTAVHENSTSPVLNASPSVNSNASNRMITGIIVGAVLLLLLIIIVTIIVMIVLFRNRRKAENRNVARPSAVNSAAGVDSTNAMRPLDDQVPHNGKRHPSAPPPTSSLYRDATLIDNDLYQDTTAHPNTIEMSPTKQRPAPPVYAVVHKKNRLGNFVVQSEASAPASASRPTTDHDTTLIDNDLYR